jgi:DNA polymerase III delta subunit
MHFEGSFSQWSQSGLAPMHFSDRLTCITGLPKVLHHWVYSFYKETDTDLRFLQGDEINDEWVESNLQTMDFFKKNNLFWISEADKIKKQTIEKIQRTELLPGDGIILISSNEKYLKGKEFVSQLQTIRFNTFRYSEISHFIFLFFKGHQQQVNKQERDLFLNIVGTNIDKVYHQCVEYYSKFSGEKISEESLGSFFHEINPFKIIDSLNDRNLVQFKSMIHKMVINGALTLSVLQVLKNHLIKIMYPPFEKKSYYSKYEQGIINAKRKWEPIKLSQLLLILSNLEIGIKEKKALTAHEFEAACLKAKL